MCCHGKLNGAYITILYMLTKIFYLANSITQIFILNMFLGFNYNTHGMYVLIDLLKNMFSSKNASGAQRKFDDKADAAAAAHFASKLNIHQMPAQSLQQPSIHSMPVAPSIMGPTVIFDSSESDFAAASGLPGTSASSFGSTSGLFSDTIYSEPAVNSPLHR